VSDLDVSLQLMTPGGWLELEDPDNGYELHKDSFATRSVSHRKQEAASDWIEGSYTARSVRENVVEEIVVWVSGATHFVMDARVDALLAGLEQLSYPVIRRTTDLQETWSCTVADYTIETSQEYSMATLALVRAKVPRLPAVDKVQVP
jgi:hypothetical protein